MYARVDFSDTGGGVKYDDKFTMVDKLKNMSCDGDIMLEPRLQEYLKKKKFNKENNIHCVVTPEQEFQITKYDKRVLRAFLSGKRDIYTNKNYDPLKKEHRPTSRTYFPSKEYREDSRVPVINTRKPDLPKNMGMFAPDKPSDPIYAGERRELDEVMDCRDLAFNTSSAEKFICKPELQNPYDGTGFDLNHQKFNPRNDMKMRGPDVNPGQERCNKYKSQYRIDPYGHSKTVDNDPRNKYIIGDLLNNKRDHHVHSKNIDPIYNQVQDQAATFEPHKMHTDYRLLDNKTQRQMATYAREENPTYGGMADMDINNKINVPNMGCRSKKELNYTDYRMSDFSPQRELLNTEVETAMTRGMPQNTTKSYGYRNPAEHYFQYIDSDFNNEDFVDLAHHRGGFPTRFDNKTLAKQKYTREIM